jgi:hypothetical protein
MVRCLQFDFGLLQGGEVFGDAEGADDVSVLVTPRQFRRETPGDPAIRVGFFLEFAEDRFAGV